MEVGLVPVRVVVGGGLAAYGAQQLAGWHLMPHPNADNRGAADPRAR
jgi:hypothetical protein